MKARGASIGDLNTQLDFLWKELSEGYSGVLSVLQSATSVLEASNAVLFNFERPANQSIGVQRKRAEYGKRYYDEFAAKPNTSNDATDLDKFKRLYQEMRNELQDNDSSTYSLAARQWATSSGLIAGNGTTINGEPNCMWGDVLTREQFVTVLYRFTKMMGEV